MCCIIKSAVLPGGITARSKRAEGKGGEGKNPRKHTNTGGVRYSSYFHDRSDYSKKNQNKNRPIMGKFVSTKIRGKTGARSQSTLLNKLLLNM